MHVVIALVNLFTFSVNISLFCCNKIQASQLFEYISMFISETGNGNCNNISSG